MLTPRQKYEVCRVKSGVALIPYFDSKTIELKISTRSGNSEVTWGDGTDSSWTNPKLNDYTVNGGGVFSKTYTNAYTGNVSVKFFNGLKDIYSIWVSPIFDLQKNKLNILNIGTFLKQFPNLYSFVIENYSYGANYGVINGNVLEMPDSVEKIKGGDFQFSGTIHFNMSEISPTSKLKKLDLFSYNVNGIKKLIGDLGKMPSSLNYFVLSYATADSSITYTAGKVWASAFDTLYLPIALSYSENDALLNDLKNSVTSAIGGQVIYLGGGYRTSASDAAVTYLTALGFTISGVSVITPLKILDLDFQNNFTDTSSSALTMVAGGTSNQPTFALSGRKAGEYCAVFNGSQSIKTTTNLPINSDKITIAFWMKTTQTATATFLESSSNYAAVNGFAIFLNDIRAGKIELGSGSSTIRKFVDSSNNINSGAWFHITGVIDRSVTPTSVKIYVNGIDVTTLTSLNSNNIGDFTNQILFIGQRAGSSLGFNGSLTKLKIYNYPFTPSEVSNLYNSEL